MVSRPGYGLGATWRLAASFSSLAHTSFFRTPCNLFFLLHHLNASDCDRTAYYRTISRKALNDRSCTPYQRQGPIQFPLECRLENPTVKVRTIWCTTSSSKNPIFSLSRILLQYAATFMANSGIYLSCCSKGARSQKQSMYIALRI